MNRNSALSTNLETIFQTLALVCLGLLILQTTISFLPDIVVLKYLTTTRLILLIGLTPVVSLSLAKRISSRQRLLPGGLKYFFIVVSLMLFWFAVSSLLSTSSISFSLLRLQVEEVLAFLLVVFTVRDEERLRAVFLISLIAVSVTAFHSIKQFIGNENTNFFLIYSGSWKAVEALQTPKGAIMRVSGYFNNPNVLATYLAMLLPITALSMRRPNSSNVMVGLLLAVSTVALFLTFSRGAIVALLVAIGIVLFRKTRLLAYSIIPLIIVALFNPFSLSRLTSGLVRFKAWSLAFEMISQRPLFGIGLGNFRDFAQNHAHMNLWHAHNVFLNTAAEAGIVSGVLLLAVFVTAIIWAAQLSNQEGPGKSIGLAIFISLLALTISSMIDDAYNIKPISYTFWIILGLLIAARDIFKKPSEQGQSIDRKQIVRIESSTAK